MHILFWFLFFAMPVLAVLFVVRVGIGLWRKAKRAAAEVGELTARVADVSDEARATGTSAVSGARRR